MEKHVSLEQLHTIAKDILEKVRRTRTGTATVVALTGDLGSGKTTLVKEIARELGVSGMVASPTFVIMKKYAVQDKDFKNLIHIDAYRLNKSSELFALGWQELFEDPSNIIIVEWPEQVPDCIPENACKLKLTHHNENTRIVKFHP